MAPSLRAVVAAVAQVAAVRPAVRLVVLKVALREVVEARAHRAHKLLHLVRLQVAVVLAPRRVPLPPQPAEVAALLLGQGLVASQSLRRR